MAEASADRGRTTRQRLLAAAAALIAEAGWGGVSTRMVAERAGVAPGVVHYHFASLPDLLITASTEVARAMLEEFTARLAEQPDAETGVEWLLGELSRYTGNDPASLLLVEMYLAAARLPELRDRLHEIVAGSRAKVAAWLRDRGHAGDADAVAAVLVAVVDGLMLHRGLDPALDFTALAGPLRAMARTDGHKEGSGP
ncbi:TetR family transcriptional regulator [Microbispora rosea subsp. aerata]|nr:TetR family transcriptional regulator [Microbispora rosea]GGO16884.1 TetR family transcriptional regulator [Microbispora rosea subsp. aerata]GIH55972.1 TetR family transcriptional regulator [Microbispora rosea subsp. aerata]GLJ87282.1 TetR family transcriptional regulator [Microbispora rosea subsp. aerata]